MSGKFALIIGNTEYIDPGLAQLTAPGRDVEDLVRVLKNQDICAFDDVKVLLNQPEHIVRKAIEVFFDQRKPDELIVLYFSGHGVRDELGNLYLAVKNTVRTRLRSTAIKSDYIREVMDQSRSKRQILILDCCNSGAFEHGTKAATGVSIGTASAFDVGYGRIILTASDSTQFAWEGDKVIGETDNSLFTHFLIQGLEGEADLDGDGRITVDEVYDYAYEKVKLATPKQTPSKFSSKQQGEIILRERMRVEDLRNIPLSAELIDEIEDTRPYVREAAVQKLEKILRGKNIALARSAREALQRITRDENTTRRVAQMATQLLESIHQIEQNSDDEQKPRKEVETHTTLKVDAGLSVPEKAIEEQKPGKRIAHEAEEKVAPEKVFPKKKKAARPSWVTFGMAGGTIVSLAICGYLAMRFMPLTLSGINVTQTPAATISITIPAETPVTPSPVITLETRNTFTVVPTTASPTFIVTTPFAPTITATPVIEIGLGFPAPEQVYFDPFTTHLGDEPLPAWEPLLGVGDCYQTENSFEISLPMGSLILSIDVYDTDADNFINVNDKFLAYIPNQNIQSFGYWETFEISVPANLTQQEANSVKICPAAIVISPDFPGDLDDFQIKNIKLTLER